MGSTKSIAVAAVFVGVIALASAMCCAPAGAPIDHAPSVLITVAPDGSVPHRDAEPALYAVGPALAADAGDGGDASVLGASPCPPPKVWAWACVSKPPATCPTSFACGGDQRCVEGVCKFTCDADADCLRIDARIGRCASDHVCRAPFVKGHATAL